MAGLADLLGLGQMVRPPGGMGGGQLNPQLMQALASLTGPGTPAAPAQAGPGMGGLDSQIEEQIRALSAPAPVVDEAVPKAPGTLQKILAALADAGSTYASGLNPYVGRTNASGALMDIGAQREGAIGRNAERRAKSGADAKRTEAELRLRDLIGKRDRKQIADADLAGKKELQANLLENRRYEAGLRADAAAETVAARREQIASQEKIAGMVEETRRRSDELQAGLHAKKATDEADKEQHRDYADFRKLVIGSRTDIRSKLASGELTPAQVRQVTQDNLDAADLTGDYRAAAEAFAEAELSSLLFPYEYQNQGPDRPTTGGQGVPIPQDSPMVPLIKGVQNWLKTPAPRQPKGAEFYGKGS